MGARVARDTIPRATAQGGMHAPAPRVYVLYSARSPGAMAPVRVRMWGLLGSTSLSFMLTRLTLPQLIPLIAAELGLTAAQTGLLLGSFFPVRQ